MRENKAFYSLLYSRRLRRCPGSCTRNSTATGPSKVWRFGSTLHAPRPMRINNGAIRPLHLWNNRRIKLVWLLGFALPNRPDKIVSWVVSNPNQPRIPHGCTLIYTANKCSEKNARLRIIFKQTETGCCWLVVNYLCESNADQPNREKSLMKSDTRILNMCNNSNGCVFRLLSELLVNIDDLIIVINCFGGKK